MTENIREELQKIIRIPTVLTCKNGEPIEYSNTMNIRKIKSRNIPSVSIPLMLYTIENGGDLSSISKFSSGDFSRFLAMGRIYD